jgi:hypothetical protein
MAWSKIELDSKIDYKQLSDFLLNHHCETYSPNETIELLLRFHYSVEDLVELHFDIDDINNVMQMLIDDYNTTK